MNSRTRIWLLSLVWLVCLPFAARAQGSDTLKLRVQVEGGDTVLLASLHKREERFYWRTVRDVKRTLPYAKRVAAEVQRANRDLLALPDDAARREYMNRFEKELFRKYEADLRRMTFSQGKMLIKLVDRECDATSYDLIRVYRGKFSAFFWQGFAKIFGADLKAEYDTSDYETRVIERIITLVEAGML